MAKANQGLSDQELWQAIRHDDMKAYNELFRRYYPRLRRLAAKYIKDPMQAEETCMDMLCQFWIKRQQINITSDVSNYLFRSMRNLLITYLRKKLPLTVSLDELNEEEQLDRPADYQLMTKEADTVYRDMLKELSPQRRKIFQLSREENLSYSEIAKETNLSVNTVKNYMVSALDLLRTTLKENVGMSILLLFLYR